MASIQRSRDRYYLCVCTDGSLPHSSNDKPPRAATAAATGTSKYNILICSLSLYAVDGRAGATKLRFCRRREGMGGASQFLFFAYGFFLCCCCSIAAAEQTHSLTRPLNLYRSLHLLVVVCGRTPTSQKVLKSRPQRGRGERSAVVLPGVFCLFEKTKKMDEKNNSGKSS